MSLGVKTYARLFIALSEGPVTAQDLSHSSGIYVKTVREFLRELHKHKVIHISQWDTTHNRRIKLPMFKLGEGTDAPKPKKLPSALVMRRWRERQKIKEKFDPFYAMCRHNVAVPQEADHM
jgi:transcription initiation factor IIE alpha subunit